MKVDIYADTAFVNGSVITVNKNNDGRTLMPGFVEAHSHFMLNAILLNEIRGTKTSPF